MKKRFKANVSKVGLPKASLIAFAAFVAFFTGMSVATAETLACQRCRTVYNACLAAGTNGQTCYDNYEVCLVRNRCWVP
jgi:hypothetical protein